ncbi:hypothetical protein [Veillonella parvula]
MLVEDKDKWCWVDDYGNAGDPQDTIQEAIDDLIEGEPDLKEIWLTDEYERVVRIGHPNYYTPEVDAERVIEDICDYDVDDEIVEWAEPYMCELINAKREHVKELEDELTDVYRKWEKRHGYENTCYVVLETKTYKVDANGILMEQEVK